MEVKEILGKEFKTINQGTLFIKKYDVDKKIFWVQRKEELNFQNKIFDIDKWVLEEEINQKIETQISSRLFQNLIKETIVEFEEVNRMFNEQKNLDNLIWSVRRKLEDWLEVPQRIDPRGSSNMPIYYEAEIKGYIDKHGFAFSGDDALRMFKKLIQPCGKPTCKKFATKKFRFNEDVREENRVRIDSHSKYSCDEHSQELIDGYPEYYLDEDFALQPPQ